MTWKTWNFVKLLEYLPSQIFSSSFWVLLVPFVVLLWFPGYGLPALVGNEFSQGVSNPCPFPECLSTEQQIPRMDCKLLKVWSLLFVVFVILKVSAPFSKTDVSLLSLMTGPDQVSGQHVKALWLLRLETFLRPAQQWHRTTLCVVPPMKPKYQDHK